MIKRQNPLLIDEKNNFAALNSELIQNTQDRYSEYKEESNPERKREIEKQYNIKLSFKQESLGLVRIIELGYDDSYTTEYKYGLVNEEELIEYKRSFNKIYANIYSALAKYCNLQKRKTGNHPFIHVANNIVDFSKLISQQPDSWFEDDPWKYNPKGLWYSCGLSWINWVNKYKSQTDDTIKSYLDEDYVNVYYISEWLPMHVYEIKTDKLNIKRISNCDELDEFCKTYKNPNATNISNYINWKQVYKDFDGLQICPYGGFCGKYNKLLKKVYETNNYDILGIMALYGKISIHDIPHLWHLHWETATGVIWKNYKALDYQRLV